MLIPFGCIKGNWQSLFEAKLTHHCHLQLQWHSIWGRQIWNEWKNKASSHATLQFWQQIVTCIFEECRRLVEVTKMQQGDWEKTEFMRRTNTLGRRSEILFFLPYHHWSDCQSYWTSKHPPVIQNALVSPHIILRFL